MVLAFLAFFNEAGAYEVNPQLSLRGNGFRLSTTGDTGTFLPLEIGLTQIDTSGNPLQNASFSVPLTEQEKMLEPNYGARIAPWFELRPGVQYVINPSGEKNIPNALVWALQGVMTF
jgi:carbohydrate-selective porin OprB